MYIKNKMLNNFISSNYMKAMTKKIAFKDDINNV